jgi:hypothetical protein
VIASKNTFRHLKRKFSYFNKNRMQAFIDLHVTGNKSAVPRQTNTKALKYDRLLSTGFNDRISVYLSVAAAAATVHADAYVYWHDNPSDQRVCKVCRLAFDSIRPFV